MRGALASRAPQVKSTSMRSLNSRISRFSADLYPLEFLAMGTVRGCVDQTIRRSVRSRQGVTHGGGRHSTPAAAGPSQIMNTGANPPRGVLKFVVWPDMVGQLKAEFGVRRYRDGHPSCA